MVYSVLHKRLRLTGLDVCGLPLRGGRLRIRAEDDWLSNGNRGVAGSSPARGAKRPGSLNGKAPNYPIVTPCSEHFLCAPSHLPIDWVRCHVSCCLTLRRRGREAWWLLCFAVEYGHFRALRDFKRCPSLRGSFSIPPCFCPPQHSFC